MTGLRMEIAKTTVKKIMESLQENDFFNVIAVSKLYHVDIVYMYVRVKKNYVNYAEKCLGPLYRFTTMVVLRVEFQITG